MVRNIVIAAALAGLAACSPAPAPQMLDMDQIAAAPAAATGPSGLVTDENISIVNDVSVTTVAVPAGTGIQKRTINLAAVISTWECLLLRKCDAAKASTTPCTTTTVAPKTTPTSAKVSTTTANPMTTSKFSTTTPTTTTTSKSTQASTSIYVTSITTKSATTTTTPSAIMTTTTPSTIMTTTSAAATTSSSVSSGSCGLRGYDLQSPPSFYVDSSGQYSTLSTCRALCVAQAGTQSFAYGSDSCLCYQAPVTGNLNAVDDSPYAFYDLTCAHDDTPPLTTSSVSTASTSTTSSEYACATQPEEGTYCGFINPEDPCAPQPDGNGPAGLSVDQFLSNSDFKQAATSAPVQVTGKSGATYAQVFSNLQAAASANSYLGLHTLDSYDVNKCAAFCDDIALCTSFNIYIERDPSLNPTKNDSTAPTVWGYWCPNPSAITNYKCTLWGSNLDASMATNQGEWRKDFQVVITGSDGYDKTNNTTPSCQITSNIPASTPVSTAISSATSIAISTMPATTAAPITTTTTMTTTTAKSFSMTTTTKTTTTSTKPATTSTAPKWKPGRNCGGKAVNNPKGWMGSKVFPGPYNPQVCGDYLLAQNAANKAAAIKKGLRNWTPCQYVNAVYYHKNGTPFGTYCNLYNVAVDSSYETYTGGWLGRDSYSCKQSWTFELEVDVNFSKC